MRELHVVAVSEDGRSVVLATSREATRGGFRVAIDERLTSAVQGELIRPGNVPPVDVSPKQIQARLRAGESVEQIAATAGVPVSRIERYAGPVLSELERVLDQARAGRISRSRLGASTLPLGEAVDRHLAETAGIRPETVTWSARREEAGSWVVQVSYVSQARRRTASWRYDLARREVSARDTASARLAHVEAGRDGRPSGAAAAAPATPAPKRVSQSRRPASEPTRRTVPPEAAPRTVAARPDAARAVGADRAARSAAAAVARASAAQTAEADRALAAARAAERTAAERAAKADATRRAKADATRRAKAEADRSTKARVKAAAARTAKAAAAKAAAARSAQARVAPAAASAPSGPPTLRVVGGGDPATRRRAAQAVAGVDPRPAPASPARTSPGRAAPAKTPRPRGAPAQTPRPRGAPAQTPPARSTTPARTAPARVAAARPAPARVGGQRASVPGWADVLLSTAPVRTSDSGQD